MQYYFLSCFLIFFSTKVAYRFWNKFNFKENKSVLHDIDPTGVFVIVCMAYVPIIATITNHELWFVAVGLTLFMVTLCDRPSVMVKTFSMSIVFLALFMRINVSSYYLLTASICFPFISIVIILLARKFMNWNGFLKL